MLAKLALPAARLPAHLGRVLAAGTGWAVLMILGLAALAYRDTGLICLPDLAYAAALSLAAGCALIGPLALIGPRR